MAKDKPTMDYKARLGRQQREAQTAIDLNRIKVGPGKYRELTRKERATYQRVVKRADKIIGPMPKPPGKSGAGALLEGLRTLKKFAERIRAGGKRLGEIAEETGER